MYKMLRLLNIQEEWEVIRGCTILMYYLFEIDDLTNLYAVFTAGVALVIAVLISAPPF